MLSHPIEQVTVATASPSRVPVVLTSGALIMFLSPQGHLHEDLTEKNLMQLPRL